MKFYATKHICGGWSVGTKKEGGGCALEPDIGYNEEQAKRAAEIANAAITVYEHKPNHDYSD